jgi:hypothetical protein
MAVSCFFTNCRSPAAEAMQDQASSLAQVVGVFKLNGL